MVWFGVSMQETQIYCHATVTNCGVEGYYFDKMYVKRFLCFVSFIHLHVIYPVGDVVGAACYEVAYAFSSYEDLA